MKFHSLKGNFIVSRYNLPDPNFNETVILMLEHNQEGAFGLIINRPLSITVHDAIPELEGDRAYKSPVFLGGPVQKEIILALHNGGELNSGTEIIPSVYFEPSFNRLFSYFEGEEIDSKILTFMGYSGWGAGQLESEMEQDTWIIIPANTDLVFLEDPQQGWRKVLKTKGGLYRVFAETTNNPELN